MSDCHYSPGSGSNRQHTRGDGTIDQFAYRAPRWVFRWFTIGAHFLVEPSSRPRFFAWKDHKILSDTARVLAYSRNLRVSILLDRCTPCCCSSKHPANLVVASSSKCNNNKSHSLLQQQQHRTPTKKSSFPRGDT